MTAFLHAGRYGPESTTDTFGDAELNVAISVREPDGTAATLYTDADRSGQVGNPVRTDVATGNLSFFADPGDYVLLTPAGAIEVTVPIDPRDLQAEQDRALAAEAAAVAGASSAVTTEAARAVAAEALKVTKAGDTMTGPLTLSGTPAQALHAAPKGYVDAETTRATAAEAANTAAISAETTRAQAAEAAISAGLQFKAARVVATANVASRSGLPTTDGVTLSANDLILLVGQSSGSQNGLWKVAGGAWTRPSNYAAGSDATATSVWVEDGTANKASVWVVSGSPPNVVDTNVVTFQQASGLGEVIAGRGVAKAGNTILVPSALVPVSVKTSAYTAAAGDMVPVDVTSASVPVTLPTGAADGTRVQAYIKAFGTGHVMSVVAGGSDHMEDRGNLVTSISRSVGAGQLVELQYSAGEALWRVTGDWTPKSLLDGTYAAAADVASSLAVVSLDGSGSPVVDVSRSPLGIAGAASPSGLPAGSRYLMPSGQAAYAGEAALFHANIDGSFSIFKPTGVSDGTPLGPVGPAGQGFTFRGAWAANTAYAAFDTVTYYGGSDNTLWGLYLVIDPFTAGTAFSPLHMTLVAKAGATGPQGPPGETYNYVNDTLWYTPRFTGAAVPQSMANGDLRVTRFTIAQGSTATKIARVTAMLATSGSTGSTFRIVGYSDNGAGYPGALLFDTGAVFDATAAAAVLSSVAVGVLFGGLLIHVGIVVQGASGAAPQIRSASATGTWQPFGSAAATVLGSTATPPSAFGSLLVSGVTGVPPNPFPAGATLSGTIPLVAIQAGV